jgi:hypothetical protein
MRVHLVVQPLIVATMIVLHPDLAPAQDSLSGTWRGEVQVDRRLVNNQWVGVRWDSVTFELRVAADSAFGTWRQGRQTIEMRGSLNGGVLHLASEPKQLSIRINDVPVTEPLHFRIEGSVTDGSMRGTMLLLPIEPDQAHPWTMRKTE